MSFNNKSILITGATGSFGKTFVKYLTKNFKPKKIIIFLGTNEAIRYETRVCKCEKLTFYWRYKR